ncbi:MAG TPA: VOC family protein [Longimicrobiales bacterium]|nr:VOC family protein [Longimicrobiales bacterium]
MSRASLAVRIVFCVSAVIAVSSCGGSEPHAPANGGFVAISVSDHDAMVGWYTAILGFNIESSGANDQRKGSLLSRDGMLLEIAEFEGGRKRSVESHEDHGIFKLGYLVSDIEAIHEELDAMGVEMFFPIVEASGGMLRTFGIRDLEGNIVQFFARTPGQLPDRPAGAAVPHS